METEVQETTPLEMSTIFFFFFLSLAQEVLFKTGRKEEII